MTILMEFPWLAFLIAAAFGFFGIKRRSVVAGLVAVAWVAYGSYEYMMKLRIWCSGECNIRVDLLMIYPILALVSVFALWQLVRR